MWHLKEKIIIFGFIFVCLNVFYAFPVFAVEGAGLVGVVVEQAAEKEKEKEKSFLDIAGNVVFWNLITFAILVVVLGKYGWKPIVAALDARAARIKEDIDRANRDREHGEKLLVEKKAVLAKAYADSQEIISKARDEAIRASNEVVEEARQGAQAVIEKAGKEIEQAKNKALLELKEELGIISLEIASKVISKSFSIEEHRSLILDTLSMYERRN